jgi:hypothetical protein
MSRATARLDPVQYLEIRQLLILSRQRGGVDTHQEHCGLQGLENIDVAWEVPYVDKARLALLRRIGIIGCRDQASDCAGSDAPRFASRAPFEVFNSNAAGCRHTRYFGNAIWQAELLWRVP